MLRLANRKTTVRVAGPFDHWCFPFTKDNEGHSRVTAISCTQRKRDSSFDGLTSESSKDSAVSTETYGFIATSTSTAVLCSSLISFLQTGSSKRFVCCMVPRRFPCFDASMKGTDTHVKLSNGLYIRTIYPYLGTYGWMSCNTMRAIWVIYVYFVCKLTRFSFGWISLFFFHCNLRIVSPFQPGKTLVYFEYIHIRISIRNFHTDSQRICHISIQTNNGIWSIIFPKLYIATYQCMCIPLDWTSKYTETKRSSGWQYGIHWGRWSLSSTSPVNTRAVTLTTFSLRAYGWPS